MELYGKSGAASCRAILMVAKAVKKEVKIRDVDVMSGEHVSENFSQLNPEKTIPVFIDDGFVISDSRAAMMYLADQYGHHDFLYPKDPKQRALVNQRLLFYMGTLYQRLTDYYGPQIKDKSSADSEKWKLMEESMGCLDIYLKGNGFAAGEKMTIADLGLLSTVSNYDAIQFDLSKYINVSRWYANIKDTAPGAELNKIGCQLFTEFLRAYSIIQ
ncbi:GstD1.2 family protein [Megaselia abdita]